MNLSSAERLSRFKSWNSARRLLMVSRNVRYLATGWVGLFALTIDEAGMFDPGLAILQAERVL
jgi:hypothetical protein